MLPLRCRCEKCFCHCENTVVEPGRRIMNYYLKNMLTSLLIEMKEIDAACYCEQRRGRS